MEQFENTFKSGKIENLLNTIINCDALCKFREEKSVKDLSPQSYFNLILYLGDPKALIKIYYDYLAEYKKNEELVTDDEKKFYNAINEYYSEEVIKGLDNLGTGRLDKAKHKTINNEQPPGKYIGVVIPADIQNPLIKIKSAE